MRIYDASTTSCSVATRISDLVDTFGPMLYERKKKAKTERYPYVVRHVKRLAIAFHEPDKSSIHLAPVPPPRPENYEELQ